MAFAGQNPGAKEKNSSFASKKKRPITGKTSSVPRPFIIAKPSILLFARLFINNPVIGAANEARIDINTMSLEELEALEREELRKRGQAG